MHRLMTAAVLSAATFFVSSPQVAAEEVLRLRLNGDVNTLDPIATTNFTIRNASYLMYDTLFAMDEDYVVQPQMAEGATISEDGLTYTITLREGLMFHDGSPVTAEDAVVSLQRWGSVDGLGQILFSKIDTIEAVDDSTLVIRWMTALWSSP